MTEGAPKAALEDLANEIFRDLADQILAEAQLSSRLALAKCWSAQWEARHGNLPLFIQRGLAEYVRNPNGAYDEIISYLNDRIIASALSSEDRDLVRLAWLIWAKEKEKVASDFVPGFSERPGMMSAYAISTVLAQGWERLPNGTYTCPSETRRSDEDPNPEQSGRLWLSRLKAKLTSAQSKRSLTEEEDLAAALLKLFLGWDHTSKDKSMKKRM